MDDRVNGFSGGRDGGEAAARAHVESMRARFDGQWDLLAQAARIYFLEVDASLDRCRQSLAAGDLDRLRDEAHGLKGSAAGFGLPELASLFGRLEELGGPGGPEQARILLAEVDRRLDPVRRAWFGALGEAGPDTPSG